MPADFVLRAALFAGMLAAMLGVPVSGLAIAQPTASARAVTIERLVLEAGEVVTVALHPTASPITLVAQSRAGLEACPGNLDGSAVGNEFSSWPSFTGFVDCIAFDEGRATLPSTVVDTAHLAFLVRPANGVGRARVTSLRVQYSAGDGYFEVLPPPIAAGARGPDVRVSPESARTLGAQAYGLDYEDTPDVAVRVRQRGRSIPATDDRPPGGDAQAYGPVRLGTPVRVTASNRGDGRIHVRIAVAWE